MRAALAPRILRCRSGVRSSTRSMSSSTTPGYFASECGKSLAQIRLSSPARSAIAPIVRSPGSKLITQLRRKYSLGVRLSGAVSAQSYASRNSSKRSIQCAIHPPPHSSTSTCRSGWRSNTPPYTRPASVRYWSMNRISAWCVPMAMRSTMRLLTPSTSKRPAPCRPSGRPVPASASYIGSKCGDHSATPCTGFGRMTPATRPMPCARSTSRAAAAGSCGGMTAVPINRSGSAEVQSAIQSFQTWCDATARSTSSKPPSDCPSPQ